LYQALFAIAASDVLTPLSGSGTSDDDPASNVLFADKLAANLIGRAYVPRRAYEGRGYAHVSV
jgi:hypothetical protein